MTSNNVITEVLATYRRPDGSHQARVRLRDGVELLADYDPPPQLSHVRHLLSLRPVPGLHGWVLR